MNQDWLTGLADLPFIQDVLFKTTVFAAAAWLVHFLARGGNPRWRAIEWRGACLGLILLPVLVLCLPSASLSLALLRAAPEAEKEASAPIARMAMVADDTHMSAEEVFSAVRSSSISPQTAALSPSSIRDLEVSRFDPYSTLLLIWAVGLAISAGRLLAVHKRLGRAIRSSGLAPESVLRIFMRVAANMGCSGRARLICSSEIDTPLLVGIRTPLIVLPIEMTHPERAGDLPGIFAHELSHMRYRDLLWERLLQALTVVYWFHPLVWGMRPAHARACEEACDAEAAEYVGDREAYSGTLARVVLCALGRRWDLAGAPMAREPEIRSRLKRLKQRIRFSPPRRWHVVTAGFLGTLVLASVGAVKLTAQPGDASISISSVLSAVASPFTSPDETSPGEGWILRFPANTLQLSTYIADNNSIREIDSFYHYIDGIKWNSLDTDSGNVKIPPGKKLRISIASKHGFNSTVPVDISFLNSLGADGLYALDIPGHITERSIQYIARLTGLRELTLWKPISVSGIKALTNLTNLERLALPSGITVEGLAYVGRMTSLKALYFNNNSITEAGLAQLKNLHNLKELELGGDVSGDDALRLLGQFPSLEFLKLNVKGLTDHGMVHLKRLPSLRILTQSGFSIGDPGVAHLAEIPTLERLCLGKGQVSDEGFSHLKKLTSLKMLRTTGIKTKIDDKLVLTDAALGHLAQIRSLELFEMSSAHFTDEGLTYLSELPNLKVLHIPTIGNAKYDEYFYTDEGLKAISRIKTLEKLGLGGFAITDKGLEHIATLPRLNHLTLYCQNITISGLNRLNDLSELRYLRSMDFEHGDAQLDFSGLTRLETLMLGPQSGSWILDKDVACLAGLKSLRSLQGLGGLSNDGLAHLSGLTELRLLTVGGPAITDDGLVHLAGLKNLESMDMSGSITGDGFRHLEDLKSLENFSIRSHVRISDSASRRLCAQLPELDSIQSSYTQLPKVIPPN